MSERFFATYWLETGDEPVRAAEVIAGEQSSGTFVALPNETPALKARSGARVELLQVLGQRDTPSLPTPKPASRYTQCLLTLSWPLENTGTCLPSVLSTVAGNLFELRAVTGLRILSVQLPQAFAKAYPGPAFGTQGTRRLTGVDSGPLIGTIIKPSVGLSVEQTAQQVLALVQGGIDFIKDDELQSDGDLCPFEQRVQAVMRVVEAGAQSAGKKTMVAFNVTGDLDQMRRRHDWVVAHGGTCVMVCLNSVGLVGLQALRKHSVLPIHGHRAGWGFLSRHPALGWDFAAWQVFWRMAGVDHLHVNGLNNKFSESDDSVMTAARSVQQPLFESKPLAAMPVFSSGQTGLQAHATYAGLGNTDLIHTVGGGIFGHPDGVQAGVQALRESWRAAMSGQSLAQSALSHPALARALEFWQ